MTPDEIKQVEQAVVAGIKEGMSQHAATDDDAKSRPFYVEPEQHYGDHGYIKGQRGAISTVRKGSLWALGASIFAFIVWVAQSMFTINPPTP